MLKEFPSLSSKANWQKLKCCSSTNSSVLYNWSFHSTPSALVFNQQQFGAVDSQFVPILFVSSGLCCLFPTCSLSRLCFPLSPSSSAIPPSVLCVSILPPLCASGQTSWALVYPLILPAAEKSRRAATQTQSYPQISRSTASLCLLLSAAHIVTKSTSNKFICWCRKQTVEFSLKLEESTADRFSSGRICLLFDLNTPRSCFYNRQDFQLLHVSYKDYTEYNEIQIVSKKQDVLGCKHE